MIELLTVVNSALIGILVIAISIISWLGKHLLSLLEDKIELNRTEQEAIKSKFIEYQVAAAGERATILSVMSRLDTLVKEKIMVDLSEIKGTLTDINRKFVCKEDLQKAITDVKQLLCNNK